MSFMLHGTTQHVRAQPSSNYRNSLNKRPALIPRLYSFLPRLVGHDHVISRRDMEEEIGAVSKDTRSRDPPKFGPIRKAFVVDMSFVFASNFCGVESVLYMLCLPLAARPKSDNYSDVLLKSVRDKMMERARLPATAAVAYVSNNQRNRQYPSMKEV